MRMCAWSSDVCPSDLLGGLQSLVDGDARAEDRRNVEEVDIVGKVTNIVGIGEDIFGKAAIDRIAGVLLFVAKRLPATQAMHAMPAGGVEPGHADPVAFLHMGDARTDGGDKNGRASGRESVWTYV